MRSCFVLGAVMIATAACALPHGGHPGDATPDVAVAETMQTEDSAAMDVVAPADVKSENDVAASMDSVDTVSPADATDTVLVADGGDGGDVTDAISSDVVVHTYATDPAHITTTDWIGTSSPGAQTQIRCADNELVIGVLGNANDYVNSFGLNCAALNSDGTLGATHVVARSGGTSGTDFDEECSAGQVVVHERGHSGSIVDAWGASCAGIDGWLGTMSTSVDLPVQGGTGGGAFASDCPAGTFLHGLHYDVYGYPYSWSSDRVWRVAMECIPVVRMP